MGRVEGGDRSGEGDSDWGTVRPPLKMDPILEGRGEWPSLLLHPSRLAGARVRHGGGALPKVGGELLEEGGQKAGHTRVGGRVTAGHTQDMLVDRRCPLDHGSGGWRKKGDEAGPALVSGSRR